MISIYVVTRTNLNTGNERMVRGFPNWAQASAHMNAILDEIGKNRSPGILDPTYTLGQSWQYHIRTLAFGPIQA